MDAVKATARRLEAAPARIGGCLQNAFHNYGLTAYFSILLVLIEQYLRVAARVSYRPELADN